MLTGSVPQKAQEYGASFSSVANLAANTPVTVVAAASNVNGVTVHFVSIHGGNSTSCLTTLLAKSTAPTTYSDGDIIAQSAYVANAYVDTIVPQTPIKIPAGKGLFFVAGGATTATLLGVLYTVH